MKILTTNLTLFSSRCALLLGAMLMAASIATPVAIAAGPAAVNLGTAGNFAILSKTGISTAGTTAIVGDIGISPAAASYITGFPLSTPPTIFTTSSLVTGKVYAADYDPPTPANMTAAVLDMQTAYTDAAGRSLPDATELGAGNISGMTLAPGLYKWGTGLLIDNTGITLSGSADDVWIFQIAGTLTVNSGAIVTLSSGAQARNIFWQVAGQTTLGTTSQFKGNILGQTAIVLNTGATLKGRALAQTAVTLNANTVTKPATDITPEPGAKLAFGFQPGNTTAGGTITPALTVRILDASNNLVTSDIRNVTLAIAENPGIGTLSGTTTVAAAGGVATFSGLSINKSGTGYTLSAASSPVLTGATSSAFDINSSLVHHFATVATDTTQTAGNPFSITITAQDANDNTVTGFTGTVDFTTNAGTMSPATSNPFTNGQLTQNVTVTQAGSGKTITVTMSGGTETGGSSTLTINAGQATKVLIETAADGSGTVVSAQDITTGKSITVYAIIRDANNNFVGNVAADSWVLAKVTGGIVSGDLVQSGDNKSALFTGHALGTAEIGATSGSLVATNSGTVTVSRLQPPSNLIVSDVPDDHGHSLKLTWTASPSETSGLVLNYRIYRSLNSSLSDSIKPMNMFTDIKDVTAWEQHAAVLVDSVATGRAEYTDNAVGMGGIPYYYWIQAVGAGAVSAKIASGIMAAAGERNALPAAYRLGDARPNPFNPSTTIEYSLPRNARVLLRMYNISGQMVDTLMDGMVSAGNHFAVWDARGMPSGVYFYSLRVGSGYFETKKVLLLK